MYRLTRRLYRPSFIQKRCCTHPVLRKIATASTPAPLLVFLIIIYKLTFRGSTLQDEHPEVYSPSCLVPNLMTITESHTRFYLGQKP